MRNSIKRSSAILLASAVVALTLPQGAPAEAAAAAACGASTALYGVTATGDLHEWLDAAPSVPGGVTSIAAVQRPSMGGLAKVIAGGSGVFYVITASGRLLWYRHLGSATGQPTWDPASGTEISHGWQVFTKVVTGGAGTIYALDATGQLHWYHHLGYLTGALGFTRGSGLVVVSKWNLLTHLVAAGLGTFYATDSAGNLRWYHHDGWLTGAAAWRTGSGRVVGLGWSYATNVLSAGGGVLLGVAADGSVRWYNNLGVLTATASWAAGSGATLPGLSLAGYTNATVDPTACSPLDRADLAGVQIVASEVVAGRRLAPTEFTCLNNIAAKESSWRWNAGSVAGAYGIPQAQPGSKMVTAGPDWQVNPVTQINWMLDYIKGKYVTPCGGWAFWQAHGYY